MAHCEHEQACQPLEIKIAYVLYLEPTSESLQYRPYFSKISERENLLQWWASRLGATSTSTVILGHSQYEADLIADCLQQKASVVVAQRHSATVALADLCQERSLDGVALMTLATGFGPSGLAAWLAACHLRSENNVTVLDGLPDGVAPSLFSRTVLQDLSQLQAPGIPYDPKRAVETIVALARATGTQPPFPLRLGRVSAAEYGVLSTLTLPRRIYIKDENDCEIARYAIHLMTSGAAVNSPEVLLGLDCWKRAATEIGLQRRRNLLTQAGVPISRKDASALGIPSRSVLFVSNASAFSGAEQSLCQMARCLDASRYRKLGLVGMEGHFADQLRLAGTDVTSGNFGFSRDSVDNLLYTLSFLRQRAPSIVHLNGQDGYPILIAATMLGIPIVQHLRNGDLEGYGEYFDAASAIVAVSEFLKLESLRYDIPADKVHVIRNEFDPSYFAPCSMAKSEARLQCGVDADAKTVVMIARFAPNKRHDVMLRAASIVKEHIPGFRLILKGDIYFDTDYFTKVMAHITAAGLTDTVKWIRFVPDIRLLHSAADVLVLCSEREGLGRCVVEALAMGVPAVVTDSGGTHEIVRDGEWGYVVRNGDYEALADRLIRLLDGDDLRNRFGVAGRQYALQNLTAECSAARMADLYDELLGSGPATASIETRRHEGTGMRNVLREH